MVHVSCLEEFLQVPVSPRHCEQLVTTPKSVRVYWGPSIEQSQELVRC